MMSDKDLLLRQFCAPVYSLTFLLESGLQNCQVMPEQTYLTYPVNVLLCWHDKVYSGNIWDWVTV